MAGFLSGMRLTPARLNPVVLVARQTSAQTVSNNTWTVITLDVEDIDTNGAHSTVSNTSRFTCPTGYDGYYEVSGGVSWASNSTGQRWSRLLKNGTEIDGSGNNIDGNSSNQTLTDARTVIVSLAAGDYVELAGFQSSGGNLATYVAFGYVQSYMTVKRVMIA